jgi:predicted nuclease of predicted toxin-antitoxin system
VKFIVDAQLPPLLAHWIVGRGHEADHVFDLALIHGSDHEIWSIALAGPAIVLTKDRDFVEWAQERNPAPQIVWLRTGNINNASLMAQVEAAWPRVVADLESGKQIVEVAR